MTDRNSAVREKILFLLFYILYFMHGVGSGGSILYSYLYNLQDSSRAKVSFGEMVYTWTS
jgi:hypothetical protein